MSKKRFDWPRLGMRTVKTAICICLCLLIDMLFETDISLYSSIVAIVCMQSTIENTLRTSVNRLIGTAIGGGFGMLLIWLLPLTSIQSFYFIVMSLGTIATIYICNVIRMPGSSVICAIVYITVIAAPLMPNSQGDAYTVAVFRIIDTVIGIVVAATVNRFIFPPKMYEDRSVRLVCNTFSQVYDQVKDRLSGGEALILYDSSLTCNVKTRKRNSSGIALPHCEYSVRVPVPLEYQHRKEIKTAYITAEWIVTFLYLRISDDYVDIPAETLPCTVVWQAVEQEKIMPLPIDQK